MLILETFTISRDNPGKYALVKYGNNRKIYDFTCIFSKLKVKLFRKFLEAFWQYTVCWEKHFKLA